MHYVYLLRSKARKDKKYIGYTEDVLSRLKRHNEGGCAATREWKPWRVEVYVGFGSKERAQEFERYLKTGSGFAFARRRFWGDQGD